MQVSRGWQSLFQLVQMVLVVLGVITVTTEKGFAGCGVAVPLDMTLMESSSESAGQLTMSETVNLIDSSYPRVYH